LSKVITQPPWEFLLSATPFALQSYELSRLNHAANLRKEIGRLLDEWIEENTCAMLARWLLERRVRSQSAPEPRRKDSASVAARVSASDNLLAGGPGPGRAVMNARARSCIEMRGQIRK